MAILDYVLDGSMIGKERLMQAREHYAPMKTALPAETEFERWTQRMAVQSERGCARELAGLDDAHLDALEREFVRCPTRSQSALARHGFRFGALLIAIALMSFAALDLRGAEVGATRALALVSSGFLLVGLTCIGVSGLTAFNALHLNLTYGTTGLYIGTLDDQHPWLYKTTELLRHEAAESYRQSVLRQRGPLRGLDYIMMRELVAAHVSLDQLCPARHVAEQLQKVAAPFDVEPGEARLVQVSSGPHPVAIGSRAGI